MNSFELAGQAMLQAHEGNRVLATLAWNGLRNLARRISTTLVRALSLTPGPHRLP